MTLTIINFSTEEEKRAGQGGSEPLAQSRSTAAATVQFCVDFQDGRCCLDRFLFLFRHGRYVRRQDTRFFMTEIINNPRNDSIGFKRIFFSVCSFRLDCRLFNFLVVVWICLLQTTAETEVTPKGYVDTGFVEISSSVIMSENTRWSLSTTNGERAPSDFARV